jgi:hypothetical protein
VSPPKLLSVAIFDTGTPSAKRNEIDVVRTSLNNDKDSGTSIDLDPSPLAYEFKLETIDGKWSQNFQNIKPKDLIQILVDL